jgi:hypothetical protein
MIPPRLSVMTLAIESEEKQRLSDVRRSSAGVTTKFRLNKFNEEPQFFPLRPTSAAVRAIKANMAAKEKYRPLSGKTSRPASGKSSRPKSTMIMPAPAKNDRGNPFGIMPDFNNTKSDAQNRPHLSNATHSHPTGAYTAGYYAKLTGPHMPRVTPSIREMLQGIKLSSKKIDTQPTKLERADAFNQCGSSVSFSSEHHPPTINRRQSSAVRRMSPAPSTMPTLPSNCPDYNRIELHISTLTDNDGNKAQMVDAANHLVRISQSLTGDVC